MHERRAGGARGGRRTTTAAGVCRVCMSAGGANLMRMAHGARMKLLDSCETARVLLSVVVVVRRRKQRVYRDER